MKPNIKLVPDVNLSKGRPYVYSTETDIRERFKSVNPNWNKRPAHLEPRKALRDKLNGWA